MQRTKPYSVEWSGDLPLDRTIEVFSPEARPRFGSDENAALQAMLERRAAEGQELIHRADGTLPDLYRLRAFRATKAGLHLTLGCTDYAEYLLTNVEHPEWRARRGQDVMSDALAVCGVLVTSDGLVPWGRRSARIFDSPTRYHLLPSGHPEPPGSVGAGLFDELHEEVGFRPDEITNARWTGFIRASASGKPELTAMLHASVPYAEIERRERKDAWEFESVFPLEWQPEAVRAWLVEHADDAVPPGHAALLLAGTVAFGAEWRASVDAEFLNQGTSDPCDTLRP